MPDAPLPRVAAIAGRRVDREIGPTRFPLGAVAAVRRRLRTALRDGIGSTVSSAACGADLLALEVAEDLELERHIVLPFAPERFRKTSVVDRPGDWGPRFDHAWQSASTRTVLALPESAGAYTRTNVEILDKAAALAARTRPIAVIIWEGSPRASDDVTGHFRDVALARGFELIEVRT